MNDEQIIRKMHSFESWFYQFDLNGHLTPVSKKDRINRHLQRKEYFFDPLVRLSGGSLAGKRVLDLACNAGFWSLLAIENKCDFVLGVDGRKMNIEQANFVFEVKGIEKQKYEFVQGNVFDFDFKKYGNFDIVLCLRLMFNISKPMYLLERISEINSDILVIDTLLSRLPGAQLEFHHVDKNNRLSAIDYQLVMYPTRNAVFDMSHEFGYSVAMLKPQFRNYHGAMDYKNGASRAFICAKKTNLANLAAGIEQITISTQYLDISKWLLRELSHTGILHWIVKRLPVSWKASLNRMLK